MKPALYDRPPETFYYDGREWPLTAYFNRVLQARDILGDWSFTDEQRIDLALFLLCPDETLPRDQAALTAILAALQPSDDKQDEQQKRSFDFRQDAALIYAAFRQTYGIDLDDMRDKLHWQRFLWLLGGLPDETRFRQVVDIRQRELPAPTKWNGKERQALMRMKAELALDTTDDEQTANMQGGLRRMAAALLGMAKKGVS